MAVLIAGMFAVSGIAKFVLAIQGIVAAMTILRTTAIGAAIATAFATSGVSIALGTAALATVGLGVYTLNKMVGPNADAGTSKGSKGISPRGNANNRDFVTDSFSGGTNALDKFIAGLNGATKATKTAKSLQDKITAEAVRKNLARQATLSGSPTIAIGGAGSLAYGNRGSTTVVVNNAGSVITNEDLVTTITDGILRTTRRGFGAVGRFGLSGTQ
jgi:hypothetical protein